MLSVDSFKDQLTSLSTLDKKFELLKTQFALDPFTFDLINTSNNNGQYVMSANNSQISNINITQMEFIALTLEEVMHLLICPY